jgi:hypothetical protein
MRRERGAAARSTAEPTDQSNYAINGSATRNHVIMHRTRMNPTVPRNCGE